MYQLDHSHTIIELTDVCFSYDDEEVVHDVNLQVHAGDYLGLVGPNGGGKTTLLKIMLGLLRPQSGQVQLFGQALRDFRAWGKIGYVPQEATLFDQQFPATAREVVAMGLYGKKGLWGTMNQADGRQIEQALQQVDMLRFADQRIGDLSGGQTQRVFIARALVSQPEVVILDEPTAGIDVATQREFYALLRRLNQERRLTLLLVSHDREIIDSECTEIATINRELTYEVNNQHV